MKKVSDQIFRCPLQALTIFFSLIIPFFPLDCTIKEPNHFSHPDTCSPTDHMESKQSHKDKDPLFVQELFDYLFSSSTFQKLFEKIYDPAGLIWDEAHNEILLFGIEKKGFSFIAPEDFHLLLFSSKIGVTINPYNHKQFLLNYEENSQKNALGDLLFEGILLLKSLEIGEDIQTKQSINVSVPHYQSLFDRYQNSDCLGDHTSLLCLQPQTSTLLLSTDKKTMLIEPFGFCFQNSFPENSSLEFGNHLLTHFDAYANNFPVLEKLRILGKWVFIAGWIQKNHWNIDLKKIHASTHMAPYLIPVSKKSKTWHAYNAVPAASKQSGGHSKKIHVESEEYTLSLTSMGGLSFTHQNFCEKPSSIVDDWTDRIMHARPSPEEISWTFETSKHEKYQVIALPLQKK